MNTWKMRLLTSILALVGLVTTTSGAGPQAEKPVGLTFFGWSDQHVQTNGDGGHLVGAIEGMNGLAGRGYPAGVGGVVGKPAFVFGLGDITEWPARAARDTYDRLITKRLKLPSYDVAGNHDTGGNSAQPDRLRLARRPSRGAELYVRERRRAVRGRVLRIRRESQQPRPADHQGRTRLHSQNAGQGPQGQARGRGDVPTYSRP